MFKARSKYLGIKQFRFAILPFTFDKLQSKRVLWYFCLYKVNRGCFKKRLNGLAVLNIRRKEKIIIDEVIDKLTKNKEGWNLLYKFICEKEELCEVYSI